MSRAIKATCPECGDIKTDSDNVVLRLQKDQENGEAEYRFICPQCHKIVVKICSWAVVVILMDTKCKIERYELPLELLERPSEDAASPISLDDVIDLGLALENDEAGWMDKMIRGNKEEGNQ